MTRLTKHHCATIVARVLETTFRDRKLRLRQRENALAVRLLRHAYGADVFERMAALPVGWLGTTKSLYFDGGMLRQLNRIRFLEYTTVPHEVQCGRNLDPPPGWIADLVDMCSDDADIATEETQLSNQIRAVLASFTTVEKLSDGWPEGYAHLPAETMAPTQLPSLRIDDLNARIAAAREAA